MEAFVEADTLALLVYQVTQDLPASERFGLQIQIRKAAGSAAANLVEGSSRRSTAEWCRFIEISHGSAREAGYLLGLATRLGYLNQERTRPLIDRYEGLQAGLYALLQSMS